MYELHQTDYVKAFDEHRREELARSWGNHTSRRSSLLTTLFGGRQQR